MKTETIEIQIAKAGGIVLDFLVAQINGELAIYDPEDMPEKFTRMHAVGCHNFSTYPGHAWPIIDREKIDIIHYANEVKAIYGDITALGQTSLIAAMRCFAIHMLGQTAQVPESLLTA